MSYLQLAENPYSHLAQDVPTEAMEMYVFIPQGYKGAPKDLYIREDLLDKLPAPIYDKMMMELDQFQNTGLSGRGAERRAERKAKREARKDKRMEARDVRSQRRADIFGKLTDTAGNLVKSLTGTADVDTTGGKLPADFNLDVAIGQEESALSKYKIPLIIGGVAVGGFIIYKMMNKKKR
jgi:hypothetical protein